MKHVVVSLSSYSLATSRRRRRKVLIYCCVAHISNYEGVAGERGGERERERERERGGDRLLVHIIKVSIFLIGKVNEAPPQ